ncbi:MAG TPA: polysaccharide deacetylase family protein [Polyangia bacterium]|nr:polysaccharide deacetylase family protein [Polyangia bacterium]
MRALGPLALALASAGCVGSAAVAPAPPNTPASPAPARDAAGLPIPPQSGLPRPAGAPGNLTVLDWAGFKGAVSWTFDDAQPSHLAHYAELAAVGVPMTFYVTTANDAEPGFDATWQRAVRDGHEIGNHSVHHCHADLTGCTSGRPDATLADEIDGATRYIVTHTPQKAVWTAASPFGDTGYDGPDETRFFVNRGVPGGTIAPGDHTDPYDLPVHMVATGETAARMNEATDAARADGRWVIFLVHTLMPSDAVWYAPVATTEVTTAMRHGKSLPDVWTGTLVDVAAYWRGQQILSAAKPVVAGAVTTWRWTLPPHFPPGKVLRVKVDGGTPSQDGRPLAWSDHGYYEVALDAGALTLAP